MYTNFQESVNIFRNIHLYGNKKDFELGQSISHIVLLAYFSKNNSEVMNIPLIDKTPSLLKYSVITLL